MAANAKRAKREEHENISMSKDSQHKKEKLGYLDVNVLSYYRRVAHALSEGDFADKDEKGLVTLTLTLSLSPNLL